VLIHCHHNQEGAGEVLQRIRNASGDGLLLQADLTYSRVISAFMLAYTIMNGVSGPLIDRLGTRVGYALTTA
jgi:MFS family permease